MHKLAEGSCMRKQRAEFLFSGRSFLGNKTLATIKVMAEPAIGEPARHKSRALVVFEGVSNTRLDVQRGIRTVFGWQPSGIELSLSARALSRENVGKHIAKGAGLYISWIHQDIFEKAYEYLKERGENMHGHTGKARGEWNLVFSRGAPQEIIGRRAGTFSAGVRKYEARSRGAIRAEEEFGKATGIDATAALRHILKGRVSEHPLVAGEMEYEISRETVEMITGLPHNGAGHWDASPASLITWTDMDITGLDPQGRSPSAEHRMHIVMWIADAEKPLVRTRAFPGASYTPIGNE